MSDRSVIDSASSDPVPGRFGFSKSDGAVSTKEDHRFLMTELSPHIGRNAALRNSQSRRAFGIPNLMASESWPPDVDPPAARRLQLFTTIWAILTTNDSGITINHQAKSS